MILSIVRCAGIKPPTGGKKDEIPPTLLSEKSTPLNKSTNYKSQIINLLFDELISIENIKKELIITPNTGANYTAKIRKNALILTFDSLLENNTTYTLNFANSIVDITERNKAKNVKIVFSTGNELDSLYIKGNVKDLMTDKPIINAMILLYKAEDTLALKKNPFYFSKTDSSGNYSIENLRKGSYQIYALKEKDNNFKYSLREEKIGFLTKVAQVDSSINELNFKLMSYDNKDLEFVKTVSKKQYVDINFNKNILDYKLSFPEGWKDKIYHNIQGNSIKLYNATQTETDSIEINVFAKDSLLNELNINIKIKFVIPKKKDKKAFKYSITPNPKYGIFANEEFKVNLKLSKPVAVLKTDSILMISGNDTSSIDKDLVKLTNNYNNLIINNLKTDSVVRIIFKRESIISVENDTLNTINLRYKIKQAENFGSIEGKVEVNHNNFILQLLNEKYQVEAEIKNSKNFKFEYVIPGIKRLRVLIDENENGKWDKGSFINRIQAERVFLQKKTINVKANWEIRNEILKLL